MPWRGLFYDIFKSGIMGSRTTWGLGRRRLRISVTRPGRQMTPHCSSRPTQSGSRMRTCARCEHGHQDIMIIITVMMMVRSDWILTRLSSLLHLWLTSPSESVTLTGQDKLFFAKIFIFHLLSDLSSSRWIRTSVSLRETSCVETWRDNTVIIKTTLRRTFSVI